MPSVSHLPGGDVVGEVDQNPAPLDVGSGEVQRVVDSGEQERLDECPTVAQCGVLVTGAQIFAHQITGQVPFVEQCVQHVEWAC